MFLDHEIVLQGFARSLIRRKAMVLARSTGFSPQDFHDLEQELTLRLLQSLGQFNPQQGHLHGFLKTVIERAGGMLLRQRWAQKRNSTGLRSLDALPADVSEASKHRELDSEDLALDMAEMLATLPADLLDLAERLKTENLAQTARDLQVPRTTLLRKVERLRRCCEDAGLQKYG